MPKPARPPAREQRDRVLASATSVVALDEARASAAAARKRAQGIRRELAMVDAAQRAASSWLGACAKAVAKEAKAARGGAKRKPGDNPAAVSPCPLAAAK